MVVFHEGRISSKPQHQFRRLSFCCPRGSHLSYRNCPTLQKTPAKYHHSKGLLDHRLCDLPDFVDSVGGTTASVTQSYRHLRVPKRPFPQSPGGCLRPAPKAQHPRPSTQGPAPKAQHPRPSTQGPAPKAQHPRPSTQGPAGPASTPQKPSKRVF